MVGNKAQKAVAAALTGILTLGTAAPALAAQRINANWVRLDGTYLSNTQNDGVRLPGEGIITSTSTVTGKDRYDTMLDTVIYNVEHNGAWQGISEVVLAAGDSYADSLAASALAGILNYDATAGVYLGAPVITTNGSALAPQAALAIEYLSAKNILAGGTGAIDVFVVGGSAAISDDVLSDVRDLAGTTITVDGVDYTTGAVTTFRKFAGTDRMDTSKKIADFMRDKVGSWGYARDIIYVAYGSDWKDALAVSSFAYQDGVPLLLTDADGLLTDDQMALVKKAVSAGIGINVVGGPAEPAANQVQSAYKASRVNKLVGGDRYETSALVIREAGYGAGPIAVATGKNFADALVAGPFIGENDGALVLVGDEKDASLNAAIRAGYGDTGEDYILGGTSAISEEDAAWVTKFI